MKHILESIKLNIGIALIFLVVSSCSKNTGDIDGGITNKTLPAVKTGDVSNVIFTGARIAVQITSTGGSSITERGICWSVNANPSKSDNVVFSSNTTTAFVCVVSDLQINTTYHIRAFASNEKGTSYGEDKSFKTPDENSLPVSVEPLLSTEWSVFTWPYNAYYPAFTGTNNVNGKYPAPCGPTTLSRVLAYWKGKIYGSGTIDGLTTTGDARFRLKFDTLAINYNNLQNTFGSNPSFDQYKDVAKLFLAAGAVGLTNRMDVGTPGDEYIAALKTYFNVSSNVRFVKRWEYTKEDWIKLLKRELAYGRPLMIAARTATSPKPGESGMVSGHWFNIEGYDSNNKFYINYNYSQPFSGYYDVDDFGVYNSYGLVVIGFGPK
ncbi:MAG: C10 family peptidase [Bacteroidales bacterium]|jgi:hypothetical protein